MWKYWLWAVMGIVMTLTPYWLGESAHNIAAVYGVMGWVLLLISEYFYKGAYNGWRDAVTEWKLSNQRWDQHCQEMVHDFKELAADKDRAEVLLTSHGYVVIAPEGQFDDPD